MLYVLHDVPMKTLVHAAYRMHIVSDSRQYAKSLLGRHYSNSMTQVEADLALAKQLQLLPHGQGPSVEQS